MLPQASVTVHDFTTDLVQPVPVGAPTVPVAVKPVLQLSVTDAPPNAAAICAVVGLQPSPVAGASVMTGGV